MNRDLNKDFNRLKNKDGNLTSLLIENVKTGEQIAVEIGDTQVLKRQLRGLPDSVVLTALNAISALHEQIDASGRALNEELLIRSWAEAGMTGKQAELLQQLKGMGAEVQAQLRNDIRRWEGELALREKEKVDGPREPVLGPEGEGQFVVPGDGRVH